MRSQHGARFQHDAQAASYDRRVRDEAHPIRAGYAACLSWVAAQVPPGGRVLELGSGTGNLTLLLPPCRLLVCADLSRAMIGLARAKRIRASWIRADLLEVCDALRGPFDAVVATYALHHLEDDEKAHLWTLVRALLAPGGRFVFGDLAGEHPELEDEFPWDLDATVPALASLGFSVTVRRFSELSWGVLAKR